MSTKADERRACIRRRARAGSRQLVSRGGVRDEQASPLVTFAFAFGFMHGLTVWCSRLTTHGLSVQRLAFSSHSGSWTWHRLLQLTAARPLDSRSRTVYEATNTVRTTVRRLWARRTQSHGPSQGYGARFRGSVSTTCTTHGAVNTAGFVPLPRTLGRVRRHEQRADRQRGDQQCQCS